MTNVCALKHTETLKLLFVLYFRILKNPNPTPLLPAALQGISRFAHLVNIDFFKDLMKVLKELVSRESEDLQDDDGTVQLAPKDARDTQHRLLCIVTAFELLSGQGKYIFHNTYIVLISHPILRRSPQHRSE